MQPDFDSRGVTRARSAPFCGWRCWAAPRGGPADSLLPARVRPSRCGVAAGRPPPGLARPLVLVLPAASGQAQMVARDAPRLCMRQTTWRRRGLMSFPGMPLAAAERGQDARGAPTGPGETRFCATMLFRQRY